MRKFILVLILLFGVVVSSEAQKKSSGKKSDWQVDEFKISAIASFSVIPLRLSGLMDVGDGSSQYAGGTQFPSEPEYAVQDTSALLSGSSIYAGANIPLYRSKNWSVGTKLNVGIGYHKNLIAAEGLESVIYDFPQYVYYRNYKGKLDFSVLAGYKYTKAPLPYHLALAGVEYHFSENIGIRIFGSVNSYKYYSLFTDGRMKPAAQFREFGIAFISSI